MFSTNGPFLTLSILHHNSIVYYHFAPIVETRKRGHTCTVWIQVSIIRACRMSTSTQQHRPLPPFGLGNGVSRSPCRLVSIEHEFYIQAFTPIVGSPVNLPFPVCPCCPCHSPANWPTLLKVSFAIGICRQGGPRLSFNQDRFVPSLAFLCFSLFDLGTCPPPTLPARRDMSWFFLAKVWTFLLCKA